jgi:DNA-binding MarR family transcriptional regulator
VKLQHKKTRTLSGNNATAATVALEHLFEVAVWLTEAMDRGLAERGLTRPRAELLWRLRGRSPMTQRELSQALRCTPRNVTDLVDALEAAGLVSRGPHPTDRRATLVSLTEAGDAAAARMQADYQNLASALFFDLSGADLTTFASVIDQTLSRLREASGGTH